MAGHQAGRWKEPWLTKIPSSCPSATLMLEPRHRIDNPAPAPAVACKEGAVAVKQEAAGASAPTESPLEEVLHIRLPEDLQAPDPVKDVLLLLKVLECLNR